MIQYLFILRKINRKEPQEKPGALKSAMHIDHSLQSIRLKVILRLILKAWLLVISFDAIEHRLKTIKDAEQVLVVSDGEIIERGDHTSLMDLCGTYAHMVSLQAFQLFILQPPIIELLTTISDDTSLTCINAILVRASMDMVRCAPIQYNYLDSDHKKRELI